MRMLAALMLTLVVAGAVACTQSPEVKKQKAVERADSYLKDGRANEAIIELRNALQIDKDYVPALRSLGRAYASKGWHADAVRELARAQTLSPDTLEITADLGRSYIEMSSWPEVEAQAKRLLAKDPQSPLGTYFRAAARLGEGKAEEALTLLEQLAHSGTAASVVEVPALRAAVFVRLGKTDEAEQAYRAALAANPKDARSLTGLGYLKLAQRRFDDANPLFRGAKELLPTDTRVRLGLASSEAGLGRVSEAIKELEAIELRARTTAVFLALGTYYLQARRPGDAITLIGPLVTRAPNFRPARRLLGNAYLAAGSYAAAIGQFEELRKQMPDDRAVRYRLGESYLRAGRARDALVLFDQDARAFEKLPSYHLERARALFALGRLADAL
jgi:tetratricopeptide (TPR) repeat protein